jgi:hypothetical protein
MFRLLVFALGELKLVAAAVHPFSMASARKRRCARDYGAKTSRKARSSSKDAVQAVLAAS